MQSEQKNSTELTLQLFSNFSWNGRDAASWKKSQEFFVLESVSQIK